MLVLERNNCQMYLFLKKIISSFIVFCLLRCERGTFFSKPISLIDPLTGNRGDGRGPILMTLDNACFG